MAAQWGRSGLDPGGAWRRARGGGMWSRGIQPGSRQLFGQIAQHDCIQMLHGHEGEVAEVRGSYPTARLLPNFFQTGQNRGQHNCWV